MDRLLRRGLQVMAAQLALLSAAIHLAWGLPRFTAYAHPAAINLYLSTGVAPDPRPFLFIAMGLAILGGMLAFRRGRLAPRTVYLGGIALMAGAIGGWALWHATGHGTQILGPTLSGGAGHTHDSAGVVATLVEHLLELPLETGSKLAEAMTLVILAVLLRAGPTGQAEAAASEESATAETADD
jgi:hypothetical protein